MKASGCRSATSFLGLDAAAKTYQAANRAMMAARENRDLTARAYQNELVETEKVIRAQLFEALMTAQYLKARYDQVAIESQISLLVGRENAVEVMPNPALGRRMAMNRDHGSAQ